jgi:hypothetical protein
MSKRYAIRLSSVGNPDFGQYAPLSPPEVFEADTLKEIRDAARTYIEKWDLGGGNWDERKALVREGKKVVAHISYNGRVWAGRPKAGEMGVEIHLSEASALTWSQHVKTCSDCGRAFRVSHQTLANTPLADVVTCIECVTGAAQPGERVGA